MLGRMRRVVLGLALAALSGCVSSSYLPHVQPNRAALVVRHSRLYLYVHRPAIQAISMKPPFVCDAVTRRLAMEGPGPLPEAPEAVPRFTSLDANLGTGVFALTPVEGPELTPGPTLLVISGDQSEHPALNLMNVIDRYNDVAECLERRR
jgi:hypothetical protein